MNTATTERSMAERSHEQMNIVMSSEPLNGRRIAICDGPNEHSKLHFWAVNGCVVICQLWSDGGWTHYIQGRSNNLQGTIDEIVAATRVTP